MPEGQLVLQAPPELAPHEGAGGALMMALPMLGSVGSIVFVAAAQPGGRGMIAAGMFLIATLGFVGVQVDRQRKQRTNKVAGSRREYLQYLSGVRKVVREAATQQRQSLLWKFPAPDALPPLAEDRARLWDAARESLRPGGTLLAVHWTRAAPEYPVEGAEVHEELVARAGFEVLVTHVERDFRLDVLARTPPAALSVAERTGLR